MQILLASPKIFIATGGLKLSWGHQQTTEEIQPIDCDECDVDQKLIICICVTSPKNYKYVGCHMNLYWYWNITKQYCGVRQLMAEKLCRLFTNIGYAVTNQMTLC